MKIPLINQLKYIDQNLPRIIFLTLNKDEILSQNNPVIVGHTISDFINFKLGEFCFIPRLILAQNPIKYCLLSFNNHKILSFILSQTKIKPRILVVTFIHIINFAMKSLFRSAYFEIETGGSLHTHRIS